MERWITTAWRAFWIGLGASAVLITQSLVAPGPSATRRNVAPSSTQVPAYDLPWATPPIRPTSESLAPHDPFDAMSGRVLARVRDES